MHYCIGVVPSSSDESDELSWFPGMLCATVGGGLIWSRGSGIDGGVVRIPSDESEKLSLLCCIWCSTRGGGSDPAPEELDSDSRRLANLELRKTWRDVSECSPSDSELEDTYVCSCLESSGGISVSVLFEPSVVE